MAFSLFRNKGKRPDDLLPAGWHFYSRPTNLEPPGTIFRIDSEGRRFIVERLMPKIDRGPEPGVVKVQSIRAKFGMVARLFGLELPGLKVGSASISVLQFELTDPERASTNDAEMNRVMTPFLKAMEFRSNNRYYIIRESRSATAMKFVLADDQLAQVGGRAAVASKGVDISISASKSGVMDLSKKFPQRLGVMFLPEEITQVRAGLAAGDAQLGRISVNYTLNWVEPDYAVVKVFFGSDRNFTESPQAAKKFGTERSDLRYGTCEVSIPRDHRMGDLEAPAIWKLEFRENPAKHVVLLSAEVGQKDKMFAELLSRVRTSANRSAFLFVHGYNVSFEDAARRTAQISYDLGFEGAPVFYSWPSQSVVSGYLIDEANIEWAETNLKVFLRELLEQTEIRNLYLIAHSMGNRALARVVPTLLHEELQLKKRLTEVILTAPDIDADVFKRDLAPKLVQAGCPVTLYASSEDLALVASKSVHGYPRAGDAGRGLVVLQGIETIDATSVDTSFIGHSYFAESRSVISDLFYLMHNGQRAEQRFGLRPMSIGQGNYWEFRR